MNMKETGIFIKRALFRFAAIILLILLISTCLFVEFFPNKYHIIIMKTILEKY